MTIGYGTDAKGTTLQTALLYKDEPTTCKRNAASSGDKSSGYQKRKNHVEKSRAGHSIYFYYFMFRSSPVKSHLHRDHATVAIALQDKASEQFMNLVLQPWRQRSLMLTLDPQHCNSNPLRPTSLMNVSFISKVSSHSQTYYLFKNNYVSILQISK